MNNHFTIMMLGYNSAPWIRRCVESALGQKYKNFSVVAVDAETNDGTYDILKEYEKDPAFTLIRNKKRKYVNENICLAVDSMVNSNTIVACLDFDDWLIDENVLSTLNDVYDDETWMTYGNYVDYYSDDHIINHGALKKYSDEVVKNNAFKDDNWRASHLRTFRRKLFQKINRESFKNPETNDWYEMAGDMALMLPLLELAGDRFKFIETPLYCYNKNNPLSDDKVSVEKQLRCEKMIRESKRYKRLEDLC